LLSLEEARRRKFSGAKDGKDKRDQNAEWEIAKPEFTGIRRLTTDVDRGRGGVDEISLDELVRFVDWSPFFHTWEMRGRYPANRTSSSNEISSTPPRPRSTSVVSLRIPVNSGF